MNRVLVFGTSGQVATELGRQADVLALGREQADLRDPAACADAIHVHEPRAVINAAAYTAVDAAEGAEGEAARINADAPAAMAQACASLRIPFVHISTDYVFAGTGTRPWRPEDSASPLNAYGRTKLAGEREVRAAAGCHAILRTSWVFSSHGNNFVKTMLRLSRTRSSLNVVSDQTGGPTPADAIAKACLVIADELAQNPSRSGTYHFSGAPDVSWYEFACAILASAGRTIPVNPIATAEYPTPAVRPLNSRLACENTEQVFGLNRPDWRVALENVIRELEQET